MIRARVVPDLIDPVIGFRQWRIEGNRLRSPYCAVTWEQPELAASCPLDTHEPGATPDASCTCGIYAYYEPCPRTASAGMRDLVSGAVVLWGGIELHGNGMRAAHCRIVALALPLLSARKRRATVAAASALDVPALPHRILSEEARRHGAPVPPSLRPPPYRPLLPATKVGRPLPTVGAALNAMSTAKMPGTSAPGRHRKATQATVDDRPPHSLRSPGEPGQ